MRKINTKDIGDTGEQRVLKYLLDKNYKIVQTNFRTKTGEIDIIAKDSKNALSFIEVKTNLNSNLEDLVFSFKSRNLKKYYNLIKEYCFTNNLNTDEYCYIDLAVVYNNEIKYYENISQDFEYWKFHFVDNIVKNKENDFYD